MDAIICTKCCTTIWNLPNPKLHHSDPYLYGMLYNSYCGILMFRAKNIQYANRVYFSLQRIQSKRSRLHDNDNQATPLNHILVSMWLLCWFNVMLVVVQIMLCYSVITRECFAPPPPPQKKKKKKRSWVQSLVHISPLQFLHCYETDVANYLLYYITGL